MRTGLVLGKFMSIHLGHLALIRYARRHCDRLLVLVCANDREPIPGPLRRRWAEQTLAGEAGIEVHYTDVESPKPITLPARFPKPGPTIFHAAFRK